MKQAKVETPSSVVPITHGIPRLLKEREAAEVLGVAPQTLASWRADAKKKKNGPVFVVVGGVVRYRVSDLEKYIEGRAVIDGVTPPEFVAITAGRGDQPASGHSHDKKAWEVSII